MKEEGIQITFNEIGNIRGVGGSNESVIDE